MIPSGNEICGKQLLHLVDRVNNVEINHEEIEEFLPKIYEKFEELDKEELIKRFVSVEFNRFIAYYQGAKDLNVYKKDIERGGRNERGGRGEKPRRRSDDNYVRLYMNVGKAHELSAQRLMGLVNESTGRQKIGFGKIEVLRNFSFFEVEDGTQNDVINAVKGKEFEGENVHVEIATAKPPKRTNRRRSEGGGGNFGGNSGGRRRKQY
ncbi:DbpA RNA binding domain-containing protein [Saccharicrinis fermentans]|uniref:DbpA RNA binding domain protein n=2 Tax=Saccharicrinis fermentans TaxID=982 RepID=W7YBH1_9BACT|nr:DbpA RNA binding domain-containing protein [Saccharicrinis fermentans]GAF04983.1 DbpA RNA binding domain protein [Saccharicrinis fermentans DSM 9555 = JCM 21142]